MLVHPAVRTSVGPVATQSFALSCLALAHWLVWIVFANGWGCCCRRTEGQEKRAVYRALGGGGAPSDVHVGGGGGGETTLFAVGRLWTLELSWVNVNVSRALLPEIDCCSP